MELSRRVLRTIGTKVRWLGPVTGLNAFSSSTLQGTRDVESTWPTPSTTRGVEGVAIRLRLIRSRIVHALSEEHHPTHWITCLASDLVLGEVNAPLDHIVPPPVAFLSQAPHLIRLLRDSLTDGVADHLFTTSVLRCAYCDENSSPAPGVFGVGDEWSRTTAPSASALSTLGGLNGSHHWSARPDGQECGVCFRNYETC